MTSPAIPPAADPPPPTTPLQVTLGAYRVALDDLHHIKDFGQKLDSMYITIVTLLMTADAYEVATTRFDSFEAAIATTGVAVIGLLITSRWRKGAQTLFDTVTHRYLWLRNAEKSDALTSKGVNFLNDEYLAIYTKKPPRNARRQFLDEPGVADAEEKQRDGRFKEFYKRTRALQTLCAAVFLVVPALLWVTTYLNLNPSLIHAIQSALP